jgi:hypothetical protein
LTPSPSYSSAHKWKSVRGTYNYSRRGLYTCLLFSLGKLQNVRTHEGRLRRTISWAVVAHAFNPSTWQAEAGGFLSSRPAWSSEWVPGQPGLHRETLSQKNQTKPNKKRDNKSNGVSSTEKHM